MSELVTEDSVAELLLRKLNADAPDPEIEDMLQRIDNQRAQLEAPKLPEIRSTEDARLAISKVSELLLSGIINARESSLLLYGIQQQLAVLKLEYAVGGEQLPVRESAGFKQPQPEPVQAKVAAKPKAKVKVSKAKRGES